ncbi:MAG: aminoglycoside phosphotransferase family protein [Coxiellaceae bacterium]|nr:aminoglycoside phosphotransferase family protein [Coxiellaceae bacterium]
MTQEKNTLILPDVLKNNLTLLYGDAGLKWLQDLPKFILHYENKWKFKAGNCFSDAQFNVVLNAVKNNNTPVVFKCSVPNKEFITEANALKHYNGFGAAQLLESDIDSGAMLIEKINPGTILGSVILIEDATKKAVAVCKKLHKPIDTQSFPTLSDWFKGFDRLYKKFNNTSGPFSKSLVEKAKLISDELLQSQSSVVLLHGDLHYANLLLSDNGSYVAIDPKGIMGELEFEIPLPRVTNPISKKELLFRVDCYIELSGFDQKRIYRWLFCKAMLAAWWTVEDSGSVSDFTNRFLWVAEIMNDLV